MRVAQTQQPPPGSAQQHLQSARVAPPARAWAAACRAGTAADRGRCCPPPPAASSCRRAGRRRPSAAACLGAHTLRQGRRDRHGACSVDGGSWQASRQACSSQQARGKRRVQDAAAAPTARRGPGPPVYCTEPGRVLPGCWIAALIARGASPGPLGGPRPLGEPQACQAGHRHGVTIAGGGCRGLRLWGEQRGRARERWGGRGGAKPREGAERPPPPASRPACGPSRDAPAGDKLPADRAPMPGRRRQRPRTGLPQCAPPPARCDHHLTPPVQPLPPSPAPSPCSTGRGMGMGKGPCVPAA